MPPEGAGREMRVWREGDGGSVDAMSAVHENGGQSLPSEYDGERQNHSK